MNLLTLFKRQFTREMYLHFRQLRLCINTCLFFLMIVVFFPLTMPPDTALLRTISPGLIWIGLLLSMFLSSERLFQQDYDDGVLEQWLVSGYSVSLIVMAKLVIHWLLNLLPMLIFCPILAVLLGLTAHEILLIILALISGSPAILALCGLAAAFSTSLKQKGVLMALILLPLTIPVMVFGSAACTAALDGFAIIGYLALLLAISIFTMFFLPLAIAAIIRVTLND